MEIWMLAAFVAYFVIIIGIGAYFYNKTAKMKEYFLADRALNPYVVALSAQASDMSGWLLMGLPGSILVAGVGEVWTGIGLAIGTYFAWLVIAKRLRMYSEKFNNSITISEYFSNRFKDQATVLRILCGVTLLVFFTFYVASAFVAGGTTLQAIFPGSDYTMLMIAGAVIVIVYTFLGGFKAVCWTDFFQGLLMLVAIVIVPLALAGQLGGIEEASEAVKSIAGHDSAFSLDFISCGWIAIVSGLAWGLGYFGMPHIAVRYMSISNPEEIKTSRRVATIWVVISLGCACLIGLVGRAWAEAQGLIAYDGSEMVFVDGFNPEHIFIEAVNSIWAVSVPALAGVLFAALMAAVMSTADSQLLVASSSVSNDIYKHFKGSDVSEEKLVWISRAIIIVIAIIAAFIALDPTSSIMNLVSFAWAGFGAAFGPLMILSLFWKRTNGKGAVAGIVVGFLTIILWNTFLRSGILTTAYIMDTPITGLYELLPGFAAAFIAIVVVSLLTAKPDDETLQMFDEVNKSCKMTSTRIGGKFTAAMAIISAALFFGFIYGAYRSVDGIDFAATTISDLSIAGGITGVYAFVATFVAGFFIMLFAYGALRTKLSCTTTSGAIVLLFAGAFAMTSGLIDSGYAIHAYAEMIFLVLAIAGLAVLIYDDATNGRLRSVGLAMVAVMAAIGASLTLGYVAGAYIAVYGMILAQGIKFLGVKN